MLSSQRGAGALLQQHRGDTAARGGVLARPLGSSRFGLLLPSPGRQQSRAQAECRGFIVPRSQQCDTSTAGWAGAAQLPGGTTDTQGLTGTRQGETPAVTPLPPPGPDKEGRARATQSQVQTVPRQLLAADIWAQEPPLEASPFAGSPVPPCLVSASPSQSSLHPLPLSVAEEVLAPGSAWHQLPGCSSMNTHSGSSGPPEAISALLCFPELALSYRPGSHCCPSGAQLSQGLPGAALQSRVVFGLLVSILS